MKKYSILFIFSIFSILLISNCRKSINQEPVLESYDLSQAQEVEMNDIFDSVNLVALEYCEGESYPGSVYKVLLRDSLIMIQDNQNILNIYDQEGQYISSSTWKRGNGPEEFPEIMDFAYNHNDKRIAILTPFSIKEYGIDFDFINEYKLPTKMGSEKKAPLIFNTIEYISDPEYILFPNSVSEGNPRFVKFNTKTGQIEDQIEFGDYIFGYSSFQDKNFYDLNNSVIFIPTALTYDIFSFQTEENRLNPIIKFQFGKDGISKEDLKESDDLNSSATYILETSKEMPLRILPSLQNMVIMSKKGDNLRTFQNYFIDRDTKEIKKIPMYKKGKRVSPIFHEIDEKGVFSILEKEDLEESPELILNQVNLLKEIPEESLVVVKYIFKK